MTGLAPAAPAGPATRVRPPSPLTPLARLLHLELRTELRRRRTLVTLTVLALIPVIIGIGAAVPATAGRPGGGEWGGPGAGLVAAVTGNGLMLPVTALRLTLGLLLPLGVSMVAADALAGEAAHGTLRGLLLAPVSRPGLVGIKAITVVTMAVVEIATVTASGLVVGVAVVGGDGELLTLSGSTVGLSNALARIGLAAGWAALQVAAVGTVALAVSALTDRPLVVLASVLGGAIVFDILSAIPALDWLRPALLTHGWAALPDVLRDPLPTGGLALSALLALGYLVVGLTVAVVGTLRREA